MLSYIHAPFTPPHVLSGVLGLTQARASIRTFRLAWAGARTGTAGRTPGWLPLRYTRYAAYSTTQPPSGGAQIRKRLLEPVRPWKAPSKWDPLLILPPVVLRGPVLATRRANTSLQHYGKPPPTRLARPDPTLTCLSTTDHTLCTGVQISEKRSTLRRPCCPLLTCIILRLIYRTDTTT